MDPKNHEKALWAQIPEVIGGLEETTPTKVYFNVTVSDVLRDPVRIHAG